MKTRIDELIALDEVDEQILYANDLRSVKSKWIDIVINDQFGYGNNHTAIQRVFRVSESWNTT